MIYTITIILLYDDHQWSEIDLPTSIRYITIEEIYQQLPDKLKRKELYKIIKLGKRGLYKTTNLNLLVE